MNRPKPYKHKETIPMDKWPNAHKTRSVPERMLRVYTLGHVIKRKPTSNTFYFFFGFNVSMCMWIVSLAIFLAFR